MAECAMLMGPTLVSRSPPIQECGQPADTDRNVGEGATASTQELPLQVSASGVTVQSHLKHY